MMKDDTHEITAGTCNPITHTHTHTHTHTLKIQLKYISKLIKHAPVHVHVHL